MVDMKLYFKNPTLILELKAFFFGNCTFRTTPQVNGAGIVRPQISTVKTGSTAFFPFLNSDFWLKMFSLYPSQKSNGIWHMLSLIFRKVSSKVNFTRKRTFVKFK